MTYLTEAAESNNMQEVKRLLKSNSGIDEVDQYGASALLNAAWCGNIELVKFLLDSGADIDLEDNDGETAIFYAVQNTKTNIKEKYKMMKFLLKHEADCSNKNKHGRNIIQTIEDQGDLKILYTLFNVATTYKSDSNLPIWGQITPYLSPYN